MSMTDEEIEQRRIERAEARLDQAREVVTRYNNWVAEDAEVTIARRAAEALGEPLPSRPRMPKIPSSRDYELVADALA